MNWYKIVNKSEKAEIWIYEEIGQDFWTGGGVTAKNFQKELSAITAKQIDLHINSPGGAVFDGVAIYNLIKQHPANVTTYIDGIAASIASVIALAGDKVVMAANALYMMHNPSGMVMGTAADMRSLADVLDKIRGTMTGVYAAKSKRTDDEISSLLDAETWMTADEAMEFGFVDEIADEMDLAACAKFVPVMAKAGFKHIPNSINASTAVPTVKDAEKGLRDAGFSRKQAKSILAEGFQAGQRDVDPPTVQRDVVQPSMPKKDRVADLLTRAEVAAPSPSN
jgi:ATP-dependent Clp endopeptidase proteolytic subunit ClpP